MRASIESTFLRTSSGEEEESDDVAVSFKADFTARDSFSTCRWASLKFLRRSS